MSSSKYYNYIKSDFIYYPSQTYEILVGWLLCEKYNEFISCLNNVKCIENEKNVNVNPFNNYYYDNEKCTFCEIKNLLSLETDKYDLYNSQNDIDAQITRHISNLITKKISSLELQDKCNLCKTCDKFNKMLESESKHSYIITVKYSQHDILHDQFKDYMNVSMENELEINNVINFNDFPHNDDEHNDEDYRIDDDFQLNRFVIDKSLKMNYYLFEFKDKYANKL